MLPLLLILSADAAQHDFNIDKGVETWTFDVRFEDMEGAQRHVTFALPAATVQADLEVPFHYRPASAANAAVAAIDAWSSTLRGPRIDADASTDGTVSIQVSGRDKDAMNAAIEEATHVRDEALARYRVDNGFTLLDGAVMPDHARHAVEYADALDPLVTALGGPGADPRAFANLALSFVQSIPYEERGRDRYRRPLSVLGANQADCDGKSTLFLAMMRSAWPDLPLAIVYVPDHAFAALGLDPESGDTTMRENGQKWVLAEPVGPNVQPAGQVTSRSSKKARHGKATLRLVL